MTTIQKNYKNPCHLKKKTVAIMGNWERNPEKEKKENEAHLRKRTVMSVGKMK